MIICRTAHELQSYRQTQHGEIGLVPTMGFLHHGHLALVRESNHNCDVTIVSIFVNPTQFGPTEDLNKYPRNEKRDIDLLQNADVNAVFLPSTSEMYPCGFNTWIEVKGITEVLEGLSRPGHFRGVATVCHKLFNLIQPTQAYFGQKDAQQVSVIKKMVNDLGLNVKIGVVPTVRENDGLAMSSRNIYMTANERDAATILYKALRKAQELYETGERNAKVIQSLVANTLYSEPMARIDYVELVDIQNLQQIEHIESSVLVAIAVYIGKTRLIDNLCLG